MKKSTLINNLMSGYQYSFPGNEYSDLKNAIIAEEKENRSEDIKSFTERINNEHPEFKILHDSYIRSKLNKIASGLSIIKIIVIIYFVSSLIVAIFLLLK
jgi:hypothetical protein